MNKLRIHYIQHVPFEGLGYIESWVYENNHALTSTHPFENSNFPNPKDIDWLIVMGGPMNIDNEEQYSWLNDEKKFIKATIEANKIVIGICLGAQLIASVLGARVYSNKKKEIGWFPVTLTPQGKEHPLLDEFPETLNVFHWHGDTFDLPNDAVHLIQTKVCANQAFIYNEKVLGLQFHLEATPGTVLDMVNHCGDELIKDDFIQTKESIIEHDGFSVQTNLYLKKLLNKLFDFYVLKN